MLKRVLLVILGPVLVLGLAEVLLRWAEVGYLASFLVPRVVEGRQVYVDNPFFGYRFFPPRMTRTSAPILVERAKAAGALRVMVLGESAAMGEPQAEFGLARFLEVLLGERYPGRRVEVVNAAMTAINSHVIAEIAGNLSAFSPDVVVLYMGNNEVVGPYGPGTVLAPFAGLVRGRVLATRLRLAQLLRLPAKGEGWSGMEMFVEHRVAEDDPRMAVVYEGFRANVQRILAVEAGAEVVVSTVAVNLRDCAPFAGERARQAYEAGRWAEARDLDELRFRADSRINSILREEVGRARGRVRLVDAERLFGEAGRADFVDHVHFTWAGNYRLACAVADAVAPGGGPWLSLTDCLDHMGYTRWNEWDLVEGLMGRRQRPPFLEQPGNAEHLADLVARKAAVREEIARGGWEESARRLAEKAAAHPGDWRWYSQRAELLVNVGAYAEAERAQRRVVELMPHRFDARGGLAMMLGYQERAEAGVRVLRETPGKHGHFVGEFLLSTARTLARDRCFPAALVFAEAALAEEPANLDARFELAARYAAVGRDPEAERAFREVLERNPAWRIAREEFTAFLALRGRWDEAASTLRAGGPDPLTQLNYAKFQRARSNAAAKAAGSSLDF